MQLFEMREFDGHERVVFGTDEATGLRAIIAIHSTTLGPAAGGCRMWPYASSHEATRDVLRLSKGMSYKNAMADLPFGGGKSVILGDSRQHKTPELFEAFGRLIDSLGGSYITAEDVGTTTVDMEHAARATRFVSGLGGKKAGDAGGDPSPKTALGVYLGIKAAAKSRLGRSDIEGLTVAIQGVGGVGYHLAHLLAKDGVKLTVADVRETATSRVRDELNARVVPAETVLFEDVDVIAPCALGAILDAASISKLRTRIIAGAANNQLAEDKDGAALHAANVLYAPDYVINAGGIISAAREFHGGVTEAQVDTEVHKIPGRLLEIFERARRENRPTNAIADQLARERISPTRARLVA